MLAGEGLQLVTGNLVLLACHDQVHLGQVIGGLGFFHVGGGHQSHIKTLLGLLQLSANGFFFGLGRYPVIPRPQYTEVTLGNPQHKILTGLLKICLRDIGAGLGFLVAVPGIHAEQWLRQSHRGDFTLVAFIKIEVLDFPFVVIDPVAGIHTREERGATLYQKLLVGTPVHAGGAPGAVVTPGGVGHIHQIGGVGGAGQGGQHEYKGLAGAALHSGALFPVVVSQL